MDAPDYDHDAYPPYSLKSMHNLERVIDTADERREE